MTVLQFFTQALAVSSSLWAMYLMGQFLDPASLKSRWTES